MTRFQDCLPFILAQEGGYSDVPGDHGGATMQGITQKAYDRYRLNAGLWTQPVRLLSPDERDAIYYADYWQAAKCDLLAEPVDLVVFDAAVQHSPAVAVRFLQIALGLAAENQTGFFGPITTAAAKAMDPKAVASAIIAERISFYQAIAGHDGSQRKFLNGWLARMESLQTDVA